MPLIKLQTSVEADSDKKDKILKELSKIVSQTTGKPEQYIMAVFENASIVMNGNQINGAFVDIRGIGGISKAINTTTSQKISQMLDRELGISVKNIYMNFTDVPGQNWGLNGGVFG